MWEVRGSRRLANLIASFDPKTRSAYSRAFESLAETPFAGKTLHGHANLRSYPITTASGEHRIIYELIPREHILEVVLIGNREGIYELLKRRLDK